MRAHSRREFIALSAASGIGAAAGFASSHGLAFARDLGITGPTLYWSSEQVDGLRAVSDVRRAVRTGRSQEIFGRIRDAFTDDLKSPPLTPSTPLPGRDEASIRDNSPDFFVTDAAGRRVLRSALMTVVQDEAALRHVALDQMEALFDETIWEGWIDKNHVRFGHPAGLRTGMLAEAVGLAYDWLHPYLTAEERAFVVEGLDRCAIRPFLQSRDQGAWWLTDLNNWLTTIVGGVGIAAMALGDAHPKSKSLVSYAISRMDEYLEIYGPDGEFNESVHYANATLRPVSFFEAHRYWSGGAENRLTAPPFPETCRWQMYLTLPPGRVAAFGDARPEARPWTKHVAAVASATRDRVLQWFYQTYSGSEADPIELLWFDESLEPITPEEAGLAKARAFPAHGGCFVSRSDWHSEAAACIVYGKAGREENHEHNDVGQLCIDGNGERLIIDIGSPKPTYPPDFFDEGRYEYHNASVIGHNVLMIGGREQRYPTRARGVDVGSMARDRSGSLEPDLESQTGTIWKMDLTPAYDEADLVTRTVIHLLPGIVAVFDQAILPTETEVSLRWHTINEPATEASRFRIETPSSRLAAIVVTPGLDAEYRVQRHKYHPPYDKGRGGVPLEQRLEPYFEASATGRSVRFLTLFAVAASHVRLTDWREDGQGWLTSAGTDAFRTDLAEGRLTLTDVSSGATLAIDLPDP